MSKFNELYHETIRDPAKICMVVHKNYHHDSRLRRYAESLIEVGASVDVLCPVKNFDIVSETQEGLRVYLIPLHRLRRSRIGYILENLLAFVLYFIRLAALHFKNHYQVIHVHNMPDFLIFSALIPKIFGAKLILDIHDPMPELFMSKYGERSNKFLLKLTCLQEKISCLFANAVITANSNFKANLISRGVPANKITVINNFPNETLFNRGSYTPKRMGSNKDFILIYPGTIAPRYGLDTAIRALPELISRIPEICLSIIGPESECKDVLRRLADEMSVSSHVQFKPLIPNEDVPVHMLNADIGIYPAKKDAHMNIATPTKVLEYAYMGIPIVSSRLKILEDLFGNSAIMFFDPGNESQFAKCVIKLYKYPMLREELVSNADRYFVEKHSWAQEFEIYLQVLQRLSYKSIEERNELLSE
jgi:glycosyltransferase involved in cell wall biosynthesis